MLVGASRFRSLSIGVAFAFVVPAAVITCGGRVEGENDGSTPSLPPEVARGGTGPTATAQYDDQISTATSTGGPTATSTSSTAPTSTGRIFLGQYVEPDYTCGG